jgi:WD40 repeat protein
MSGIRFVNKKDRQEGRSPILIISVALLILCAALPWARLAQADQSEKILYVGTGDGDRQYLTTVNPDGTGRETVSSGYFMIVAPRFSEATGAILFTVHDEMVKSSVHVLYPEASPEKIINNACAHCWSPDGKFILYSPSGSECDLYRYNVATKGSERLTKGKMVNEACWSPDGKKIVLSVMEKDSSMDLYVYTLEGKSLQKLTDTKYFSEHSPSFTPDGKYVIYCHQPFEGLAGCKPGWLACLELATRKVTPLPVKDAYSPSLSSDGKQIVYEGGSGTGSIGRCLIDGSSQQTIPVNGSGPVWMK